MKTPDSMRIRTYLWSSKKEYYQASLDGSEVAIMADYPDLYPFVKVSVRKLYSQGRGILPPVSLFLHWTILHRIGAQRNVPKGGRLRKGQHLHGRVMKKKGGRQRLRTCSTIEKVYTSLLLFSHEVRPSFKSSSIIAGGVFGVPWVRSQPAELRLIRHWSYQLGWGRML